MSWISDFLETLFPVKERYGPQGDTVIVDIPAELYYKELALHTAVSLISNAISRAEIRTYTGGKPVKDRDYYLLNVAPNVNETSSVFWHKVINRVVRKGEAMAVEARGSLYFADSYVMEEERSIRGNLYSGVTVGNFTFDKKFRRDDVFLFQLDNINVRKLVDGMYSDYGKVLTAAAAALKRSNGQKYKLHIEGTKAGDEEFNREFRDYISAQLKTYMAADAAVYPEFDGYKLEGDPVYGSGSRSAEDFLKLRKDLFETVAGAMHIPQSMMMGNITNMADVIGAFLTFGADPYADMITEALNKRAGYDNFAKGNRYEVDTRRILHRDTFAIATNISTLVGSGTYCVDEIRELLGEAPLNEWWSRKHFITKNFEEIERFLKTQGQQEGGEGTQ